MTNAECIWQSLFYTPGPERRGLQLEQIEMNTAKAKGIKLEFEMQRPTAHGGDASDGFRTIYQSAA